MFIFLYFVRFNEFLFYFFVLCKSRCLAEYSRSFLELDGNDEQNRNHTVWNDMRVSE